MISKELLSEVLDLIIHIKEPEIIKNVVHFKYQDPHCTPETYILLNNTINIYELTHKCKEWVGVVDNGSTFILSGYDEKGLCLLDFGLKSKFGEGSKSFYADSEPEAVFRACQWIIDKKETK